MDTNNNQSKGLLFDIQRCCLNDGPGIRTTIFLKGCPLSCKWCHNPESQSFKQELMFYKEKCTRCGACAKICGCHSINSEEHLFNRKNCILCFKCIEVCPVGAFEKVGFEKTIEEIFVEVMKDKKFYENSGGGLTISGGEPMAQFNFLFEILKTAKENQLHTAIETSGFAKTESYEKVMPFVDLFLFDYKATENSLELIGATNEIILNNLDFLDSKNANIILRCPFIAGVNDTELHIRTIAKLKDKYKNIKSVEIMPYHNMGIDKGIRIGKPVFYQDIKLTEEDKKQEWILQFKNCGLDDVKFG